MLLGCHLEKELSDIVARNCLRLSPQRVCTEIQNHIKDRATQLHRHGAAVGLSGGLDSSVVATLSSLALGPANVLCLFMPEKHTSKESLKHARLLANWLGAELQIEDVTPRLEKFGVYRLIPRTLPGSLVRRLFDHYARKTGETPFSAGLLGARDQFVAAANAFYRLKHRMRMLTLYYHAELENLLVVGSANKTEFSIGLFVQYGCDNAADIMPLRSLYKTQVRQLAEYLAVPRVIIEKPPSPDLLPGLTDESVIGVPYQTLDLILCGLEGGLSQQSIADECSCSQNVIDYVEKLMDESRHKRNAPYVPDLFL